MGIPFNSGVGFVQIKDLVLSGSKRCLLKSAIRSFRVKRTIAPHNAMPERSCELELTDEIGVVV